MVDQCISYTLNEALNTIRFGEYQSLVLAYAGLGWIAEAMGVMLLSFSVPTLNRGTWMNIFQAFWSIGTVFQAALAWIVMPGLGRKWLVALSSLPCIIMLLSYDLIPESPRYLCMKGRMSEAQIELEKVAALNKTELPPGMLISDQSEDRMKKFLYQRISIYSPEDQRKSRTLKQALPLSWLNSHQN
ncbi:hypothetical protein U1Q18_014322 [Sarracenia purpurea var. burkii]